MLRSYKNFLILPSKPMKICTKKGKKRGDTDSHNKNMILFPLKKWIKKQVSPRKEYYV